MFTVDSTGDTGDSFSGDGICDDGSGACTLRAAIEEANASGGADTATFDISGAGPHTISPGSSPLPVITESLTIDGYTQSGALPATATSPATLKIELDGFGLPVAGYSGLVIGAGAENSTVRGLAVTGFVDGHAILVEADGAVIEGNHLGADVTGALAKPNWAGVTVFSDSNRIGTDGDGVADAAERNVIPGQFTNLQISGDHNVVAGNFIGTNADGTAALGTTGFMGVLIGPGNHNLIGTDGDGLADAAERNVIVTTDFRDNIRIQPGNHNVVAGNYIGTDATGTAALGNGAGIRIDSGSEFNLLGTDGDGVADAAERNIIATGGVEIRFSDNNVVAGNYIGTDVTGTVDLSVADFGVKILQASLSRIGTDGDGSGDAAEGNLVSGNNGNGIFLGSASDSTVAGNLIGTDSSGTAALGNGGHGIRMEAGQSNIIGTDGDGLADVAERNVISANALEGINLEGDANVIAGNYVGTDVSGTQPLGNGGHGVVVGSGQFNLIGTDGDGVADVAERNVVSANASDGIQLLTSNSHNNVIAGNYVGTDLTGTVSLGNAGGITVFNATSNTVGTDGDGVADAAERNLVSGNSGHGIMIGFGADDNVIAGNYVGTDATGTAALGNSWIGVVIIGGAQSNTVGTDGNNVADADERNIISANGASGVAIYGDAFGGGDDTNHNAVAGNYIGTDVTGTAALGNLDHGVLLFGGRFNIIGTDGDGVADAAERNVIAANNMHGVVIPRIGTDENVVAGNFIGTDKTGTAALGNRFGVSIGDGAKRNRVGTDGNNLADADERNIISGNTLHGILVFGPCCGGDGTTNFNVFAGNYIGTDVFGTAALGNGHHGVALIAGKFNIIGTDGDGVADAAERNVISGNGTGSIGGGILVAGNGTEENMIGGNLIGTDVSGAAAVGNGYVGVFVRNGARSNQIGGSGAAANVIAFNNGPGVAVSTDSGNDPTGNQIRGNSIHSNAGLGIDLNTQPGQPPVSDGVTANDAGDADTGGNNLQNFPVLTSATAGATTRIVGSLNSTPNTQFTIEFFGNTTADPSGHGEGERFLGSITVLTDVLGDVNFDVVLTAPTAGGESISATATSPAGNTSEFSQAVESADSVPVFVSLTNDASQPGDAEPGDSVTVTAVFSNQDAFDTHEAKVDFGDGSALCLPSVSPGAPGFSTSHVYQEAGIFQVSVTVTDDEGNSTHSTTTVVIQGIRLTSSGELQIVGSAGADEIEIEEDDGEIEIEGEFGDGDDEVERGFAANAVQSIVILLGTGDDSVEVDGAITADMVIDGGAGDDSLEGGRGNDLLLGGLGNDQLKAGRGRNILIGGFGKDSLKGKHDDDLLIGGSTVYGSDLQVLDTIMAEWLSQTPYEQRVASLTSGPLAADQLIDDGDRDKLHGKHGRDLFFAGTDDKIKDLEDDEVALLS